MTNYYQILGLPNFTTDFRKIREAYILLIKYYHPDAKNVSPEIADEKTKQLNMAYDVLTNPSIKMSYDTQLKNDLSTSNITYINRSKPSNAAYNKPYTNANYNNNYSNKNTYTKSSQGNSTMVFWLVIIFLILFIPILVSGTESTTSSSSTNTSTTATTYTTQSSNLTPVSISSGTIVVHSSDEGLAPLTIETSSSHNYYVSLKDITHSGRNNMSFYIKGGKTEEVLVPLGTYEVYYATGDTWYGKTYKFGNYTDYCKCEGTFRFYDDGQYYNGYTLTLYGVSYGNMETEDVNSFEFPN